MDPTIETLNAAKATQNKIIEIENSFSSKLKELASSVGIVQSKLEECSPLRVMLLQHDMSEDQIKDLIGSQVEKLEQCIQKLRVGWDLGLYEKMLADIELMRDALIMCTESRLWLNVDPHIRAKKKIHAIKAYRAESNVSLSEAKKAVEARAQRLGL